MLKLFVLTCLIAAGCCETLPSLDASDAQAHDAALDSADADASRLDAAQLDVDAFESSLDAADADAEDGQAPPFCIGVDAAASAALHESCACQRATGRQGCSDTQAQCIAAPAQPDALGCHAACDATAPCPSGERCVQGFCWLLCRPTVQVDCPSTLECAQYENPVAGTVHVCVPRLGYRAP